MFDQAESERMLHAHCCCHSSFNEQTTHAAAAAGGAMSPATTCAGKEACSTGSSTAAADLATQASALTGRGQGQGKVSTGVVAASLLSAPASPGHSLAGSHTGTSGSDSGSGAGDAAAAVTVTFSSGNGKPSKLEWILQQQEQEGRAAGTFQRGSTVCVAALGRGDSHEYEEVSGRR